MNYVEVSLEFCFKGVCYSPTAVIDLDSCMHHQDLLPYIYSHLASENGIGIYSYEFDVMVMEEITFSSPSGLVAEYVSDGHLDIDGFKQAWLEENCIRILQPIASRHLGIENLNNHPDLKAALIAAYHAK